MVSEMATSARKENRWKKQVQEFNDAADKTRREIEAASMVRGQRKPAVSPERPASRRNVRSWMRSNAHEYECATQLAEAANVEFDLPGEGLDDETHWVWDEAADAMEEAGYV